MIATKTFPPYETCFNVLSAIPHDRASVARLPVCRSRKVTMSELVDPVITSEFYEISH